MSKPIFLLVASYPDSLIKFRGPLMDSLIESGVDVHVAVPDLDVESDIAIALSKKGVHSHRVPLERTGLNPFKDFLLIFSLLRLMLQIKPRFILSYTIKPVIYGSIAAWLAGVKNRFALITGLGYAFTGNASGKRALLRKVVQRLYWFALTRSHGVFFQNPDDQTLFRELRILPESVRSFVVNGSGVDVSEYLVAALPSKPSFLLIARLLGDKGVREYVQAAKHVKTLYPSIVFRLVGWLDDNPDAVKQHELDEWIQSGTVEFLGKLQDVRPAISECTVYVLPSYREGTPRTVLEAMAMGRAVITTDAPGCRETVIHGDNGFLVPVMDVDSLSAAMKQFIASPELSAKMGKRSREIAESKYDVRKVNAFMLERMRIQ